MFCNEKKKKVKQVLGGPWKAMRVARRICRYADRADIEEVIAKLVICCIISTMVVLLLETEDA
jgi:hypothetical protein